MGIGSWWRVGSRKARETLTASLTAKTTYAFDGTPTEDNSEIVRLNLLKARSLLSVIDSITGDNAGAINNP
jgi:hypothetical protein